jgi:hypothetical protein
VVLARIPNGVLPQRAIVAYGRSLAGGELGDVCVGGG